MNFDYIHNLDKLNITFNNDNKGLISFNKTLKVNYFLTYLYLKCNEVEYDSLISLADALKFNSSLTKLDLSEKNKIEKKNMYIPYYD